MTHATPTAMVAETAAHSHVHAVAGEGLDAHPAVDAQSHGHAHPFADVLRTAAVEPRPRDAQSGHIAIATIGLPWIAPVLTEPPAPRPFA